jgi:hypothetical protein
LSHPFCHNRRVANRGSTEAKQARFIRWLCTPKREREPQQQNELAKLLRVSSRTLVAWKNDPEFVKAWEAHYLATVGSPERKQTLMDTLYKTGSDADDPRHVTAASKYLELADGLRPTQIEVTVKRPAEDLSDDQLAFIANHYAEQEQQRRLRLVENE